MPFAAAGGVSSDPLPDSIEITFEQYQDAVAGMCKGYTVSTEGGVFSLIPPALPVQVLPSEEELRGIALAWRDKLLAEATSRIAPLQDAADLGVATETESVALVAWKRYRIALNRIEQQDEFPSEITWPEMPGG